MAHPAVQASILATCQAAKRLADEDRPRGSNHELRANQRASKRRFIDCAVSLSLCCIHCAVPHSVSVTQAEFIARVSLLLPANMTVIIGVTLWQRVFASQKQPQQGLISSAQARFDMSPCGAQASNSHTVNDRAGGVFTQKHAFEEDVIAAVRKRDNVMLA